MFLEFSPLPTWGNWSNFDEHIIYSNGRFNQQLDHDVIRNHGSQATRNPTRITWDELKNPLPAIGSMAQRYIYMNGRFFMGVHV